MKRLKRRIGLIDGEPLKPGSGVSKRKRKKSAPEDENVARLDAAGLYIKRLKPGQHCVVCPWEDEHTGEERDDDTFYFEPHYNGHDIPAFVCHHGSHEDKKWVDVLDHLGIKGTSFTPVDDDGEEVEDEWVYVHRLKAFWDPSDGAIVEREAYDSEHGGKTRKGSPTDRFLLSPKTKKAKAAVFAPGRKRIYRSEEGLLVLNTYRDLRIAPDPSVNVSMWTEHLDWLVPDEESRERLCDWLAWNYQHPEQKITWGPILYSQSEGVGKTTVFNALAKCVGLSHVSEPTQAELNDKFNDWCFGKLLVKIEELISGDRYDVANKLKPVVTNPTISVRAMYKTGFSVPNHANVCASTNHMRALPFERTDRRWMLIQCVEAEEPVRRPRMKRFHRWLEKVGHGGIAHWFNDRDVSRFQPKGEAPMTSLKADVSAASLNDLDHAVDLAANFDLEPVMLSSVLAEFLQNNGCELKRKQIGLVAARRNWMGLPDRRNRYRHGGYDITAWSPCKDLKALEAFMRRSPKDKQSVLDAMGSRIEFSSSEPLRLSSASGSRGGGKTSGIPPQPPPQSTGEAEDDVI